MTGFRANNHAQSAQHGDSAMSHQAPPNGYAYSHQPPPQQQHTSYNYVYAQQNTSQSAGDQLPQMIPHYSGAHAYSQHQQHSQRQQSQQSQQQRALQQQPVQQQPVHQHPVHPPLHQQSTHQQAQQHDQHTQMPPNDPDLVYQSMIQMEHQRLLHRQMQQQQQADRDRARAREDRIRRLRMLRKEFFQVPLVENKYKVKQIIGEGASGVVCSATDTSTNQQVAVKRVSRGFDKVPVSVRILRELKFLRLLRGHQNIVEIRDILMPAIARNFDDIFVVFEFMATDLNHLLRSKPDAVTPLHVQYFMLQLLMGVNFLHSCGVFHRDLKPNNVLINDNCELRICDFGLARANIEDVPDIAFWTDYVATRWYRAPELIMTHFTRYSTAIDIWSVGCIFAEMLGGGKPLFPGKDGYDQLQRMVSVLGSPDEVAISKVQSERVRSHFRTLPRRRRTPFKQIFPNAGSEALSLLEWMLEFDPAKRPTAGQALAHPYFRNAPFEVLETVGKPLPKHEFAFERTKLSPDSMRRLFLEEIALYHPQHAKNVLSNMDRYGDLELPSQAETFASAMQSVQDGISQRKTTSMPKAKFQPLVAAYRAKQDELKRLGQMDVPAKEAEMQGSNHPENVNGVNVGSSASWYGGTARRNRPSFNKSIVPSEAKLQDAESIVREVDQMAVDDRDDGDMGFVRVDSGKITTNRPRRDPVGGNEGSGGTESQGEAMERG